MSKDILDQPADDGQVFVRTVGRVVIVIGLFLGAAVFALDAGLSALSLPEGVSRQFSLGGFLFLIWLAVNSGIRAVNKLSPSIAVGWLFITGIGIGLWGQAIYALLQWAVPLIKGQEVLSLLSYFTPRALPSLAISLLVAVLTTITIRVESKLMATLLRVLIFGLLALLIYLLL